MKPIRHIIQILHGSSLRLFGGSQDAIAAKRIGAYAAAIAVVSGANLISFPLLLRLLGNEQFGRWSTFEPIMLLAVSASLLGAQFGILKTVSSEGVSVCKAVSDILPLLAIPVLFTAFITAAAGSAMLDPKVLVPAAVTVICEALILLATSAWRAEGRASLYAAVEGTRALSMMVALFVYCYMLDAPHFGVATYMTIRAGLAAAVLPLAWWFVRPGLTPSWREFKLAIAYGAPIVVASLLQVLLLNVDRYFVNAWMGAGGVAVYVAHLKIASLIVTAINAPFYSWYAPEAIRRGAAPAENAAYFAKTAALFYGVLLLVCTNLVFAADRFWAVLFPTVAFDPFLMIALISSFVAISMVSVAGIGTLQPKKTFWSAVGVLIGIICMSAVAFSLGKILGLAGVAAARSIGMLAYLFAAYRVSQLVLGLRLPMLLFGQITAGAVIVTSAVLHFSGQGIANWLLCATGLNVLLIAIMWRAFMSWNGRLAQRVPQRAS